MSKLQRAVEGQTIQFLPLPKIFNTLSADLPSGAVKLPNGDVAYWRLHRNLAELKKHRKNVKELTTKLAQALSSLVNSDSFKNHYGIAEAPQLPSENQLVTLFRNLLQLNTNRVDYSSVSHGRNKPLVESIQVPLGNLVFFNAIRGVQSAPKVAGIKGKLWLKEGSDADQAFAFTIVSPVVELADFIGPDRLQAEILNKIKLNLPALAFNPKITFEDGQFSNYVGAGMQALGEKFQSGIQAKKEKARKQQPVPANPASEVAEPASTQRYTEEVVETPQAGTVDIGAAQDDVLFIGSYDTQEALEAFVSQVDPSKFLEGSWAMVAGERVNVEQIGGGSEDEETAGEGQGQYGVSPEQFTDRQEQREAPLGTVVLAATVFEALSNDDKGQYLAAVEKKIADPAQWPFVKKVLESGILEVAYKNLNETLEEGEKISQSLYIARVIFQMTNDQFASIVGEESLAKA